MTTSIPEFSAPIARTGAPLERLAACHRRIETLCTTLRRLVPHLLAHSDDDAARTAAISLMRYFDTSALHDHADEEDDLFPALIQSMAGSDAICLREIIDVLKADHRAVEACWRHLRVILGRIAAGECVCRCLLTMSRHWRFAVNATSSERKASSCQRRHVC